MPRGPTPLSPESAFRLLPRRKGPRVSEHALPPALQSSPRNCRGKSQGPARLRARALPPKPPGLAACPGEVFFPPWSLGQRAAGNQMSPLGVGDATRGKRFGAFPMYGFSVASRSIRPSPRHLDSSSPPPSPLPRLSASFPVFPPHPASLPADPALPCLVSRKIPAGARETVRH